MIRASRFINSVIVLRKDSNHFCKMPQSPSRFSHQPLGCAMKKCLQTGDAPEELLVDGLLVCFLIFHLKDIKQQQKESWQPKVVSVKDVWWGKGQKLLS